MHAVEFKFDVGEFVIVCSKAESPSQTGYRYASAFDYQPSRLYGKVIDRWADGGAKYDVVAGDGIVQIVYEEDMIKTI